MKINLAKQKMLRGEPAFGYSAKLGSSVAAELLGQSGVDFVMIDGQHGSWGQDSVIPAISAICSTPAMPYARVIHNTYSEIARLLDAGILGIIVPMVDTVEQAQAVAMACRFPPRGERSNGWGRAAAYGADYADCIDDELFVAVQLESAQAMENAEAIMAVPGIDGCMVGPADLAFSMGFHPRDIPKHDEHARALERAVQACRNTGKIPGIDTGAYGPESAPQRVKQGFIYIPMGADARFIVVGAPAGLKLINEAIGKK
jgi:4-hydroxy-2-oxoheptanedioate aldolase